MKTFKNLIVFIALLIGSVSCDGQMVPGIGQVICPRVSTSTQVSTLNYGLLYNFYVISDSRNIAPSGWHVPTLTEWQTLLTTCGGASVAGYKLREVGTAHWLNANGTDIYGFMNRGSGWRDNSNGSFQYLKGQSAIWTSSVVNSTTSTDIWIANQSAAVCSFSDPIKGGEAIVLIKDDSTDPGTMTDNSGNVYATVKIGNQVWMKGNLMSKHYRNGDAIPQVTVNATWATLTSGAWCYYNNLSSNQ